MLLRLLLASLFASIFGGSADACDVANVLFGKISLEIIPHTYQSDHWESALIRNNEIFGSEKENSNAIRGEITVDRGDFAVRRANQEVVGYIFPDLRIDGGDDDDCDKKKKVVIKKVKQGIYVILNGDTLVGTIKGRFPLNPFGVR